MDDTLLLNCYNDYLLQITNRGTLKRDRTPTT